jgi:CHAT domain-containing protein
MPDARLPTISPQTLFAVGNPALNSGEKSAPGRPGGEGSYAPLPEQGNLVRTLGQIYGSKSSMVIINEDATEETVKAQAGKYRILHFSTHGILDNDNPLYSHLLLSPASAKEDGFLEAREIMQLKLQADLAVLSGCETARGRVRAGEGLMGMSWAFFVAGTPTTVASQWQVDSASTARLMIAFHRRLKAELLPAGLELSKSQGLRHPLVFHRLLRAERSGLGWQMSQAEILREASLQLMSDAKYRHPFYWAGFVVMGDGL